MSQGKKRVVLICCEHYFPAYKSGGALRTLMNTVDRLGDDFDFRITTRDHDGKADRTSYSNVEINSWNQVGKALVRYISKDRIRIAEFRKLINEVSPDVIYLNSFFSTFSVCILVLRRLGRIKDIPVIVAPSGELSNGALQLKSAKKQLYLRISSVLGLYKNIIWKTSSEFEAEETERLKGSGGRVFVAANITPRSILPNYRQDQKRKKLADTARFIFLSRIHPTKNLGFLLELLVNVSGNVKLDVFGPVADKNYLKRCQKIMKDLPENVSVEFKGSLEHDRVAFTIFDYEFFVLPTLGENFGHVFIEAMSAGCPLVISDRTPWIDLERKGVGWDISLNARESWVDVLNTCIGMDDAEYSALSANSRAFAERRLADDQAEKAMRKVFEYSLNGALMKH